MTGPSRSHKRRTQTAPEAKKEPAKIARRLINSNMKLEGRYLAASHAAQMSDFNATTEKLAASAQLVAEAQVRSDYAFKWAEVLKHRGTPDFLARVAALKSEEDAAIRERLQKTSRVIRKERAAARGLLLDNQRRQRKALANKRIMALLPYQPYLVLQILAASAHRRRAARQFEFVFVAGMTTLRGLARLLGPRPQMTTATDKSPSPKKN